VRWRWEEAGKGRKVSLLVDSVGYDDLISRVGRVRLQNVYTKAFLTGGGPLRGAL
jgi:hypothetical protein